MELYEYTAAALAGMIQSGEVSAREATEAYLARMEETDYLINAYITKTPERALKQADQIDRMRKNKEALPPLAGVPYALKDLICTNGIRTTAASKMLKDFVPPYDATVFKKLNANGAVLLGKANMDEFAMGSGNENSFFGPTHNPHDLERVTGGSSGGSAGAVAAKEAAFALGTDTGGSIRQPASLCGVVGMRPTYGTVSRFGVIAFASSLDQVGPLTRDVTDCALVMNAICGRDPMDATSMDIPYPDYTTALNRDVKGMRFGLPKEYFTSAINPEVRRAVMAAAKRYESMGATIEEISLPSMEYDLAAHYIVSSAEAASNLARYDGVEFGYRAENVKNPLELYMRSRSEGFGDEVKMRILLGTYMLSSGYYDAYYKKAQKARTLLKREFDAVYEHCDLLLTPVCPTTAWKIGRQVATHDEIYAADVCTVSINAAGLCGMSVPCGADEAGLPIGMQLIGPALSEKTLLRAAHAYEQEVAAQ